MRNWTEPTHCQIHTIWINKYAVMVAHHVKPQCQIRGCARLNLFWWFGNGLQWRRLLNGSFGFCPKILERSRIFGFAQATVLIHVTMQSHRAGSQESKGWSEGLFVLPGSCKLPTQGEVCSCLFRNMWCASWYLNWNHVQVLCSDIFLPLSVPFMCPRSMREPWSMSALCWKMNQEITRLSSWRSWSIRPWRKVRVGRG